MKKRIIAVLLLFLLASSFLFSERALKGPKGLDVTGVIGASLNLRAVLDYSAAYAFSLDVGSTNADAYQNLETQTNKTGLRIASWSMQSNSKVDVVFWHDWLTHESDATQKIDYNLAVQVSSAEMGFCKASADGSDKKIEYSYTTTPVGVANYGLFVRLEKTLEEYASYAPGMYYSTIHITATQK